MSTAGRFFRNRIERRCASVPSCRECVRRLGDGQGRVGCPRWDPSIGRGSCSARRWPQPRSEWWCSTATFAARRRQRASRRGQRVAGDRPRRPHGARGAAGRGGLPEPLLRRALAGESLRETWVDIWIEHRHEYGSSRVWFTPVSSPTPDGPDEVIGVLAMLEDVTTEVRTATRADSARALAGLLPSHVTGRGRALGGLVRRGDARCCSPGSSACWTSTTDDLLTLSGQ